MYNRFAITSWFNIPAVNPIYCTINNNGDHFIVLGCSNAYGYQLSSYSESWAYKLSELLQLNHVNLGMPGASLDWITDRLDQLLELPRTEKFIIVQLTYTHWSTKSPRWLYGDLHSRKFSTRDNSINITTIKNILEKYKNYNFIYFTNIWQLDNKTLTIYKSLAYTYKNFLVNTFNVEDFGIDNSHPGSNTHKSLASFLSQNFKQYSSN